MHLYCTLADSEQLIPALRKTPHPNPRQGQSVSTHSSRQNAGQCLALPTPHLPPIPREFAGSSFLSKGL